MAKRKTSYPIRYGGNAYTQFLVSNLPKVYTTSAGIPPPANQMPKPPTLAEILAQDALYQASLANLQAQSVSDRASLAAARQRALINFGDIPQFSDISGVGNIGEDITQAVRNLAAQNTQAGLSTMARLNQANQLAIRGINNTLAAHGMLTSGELGYDLGQNQLNFSRGQYDARMKLADYLAGAQASFAAAEMQRKMLEAQLAAEAAARAAASGGGGGTSGTTTGGGGTAPPSSGPLSPGSLFGGGLAPVYPPAKKKKPLTYAQLNPGGSIGGTVH